MAHFMHRTQSGTWSVCYLFSPSDAVSVLVIAAGGIADGQGVAAALILGASAVQMGRGFLRCPEAKMHPAYVDRFAQTEAHETMVTRAFSGRPGRSAAAA